MADNVAITAGTGTTIATDDVGGVHYQIIKLAFGILDTATLVSTSNGLPVQVLSIAAGSNAIGKLAANSGVDIGDVDILSIAAGSNLIGNVGIGVRTSGGLTIVRDIDLDEATPANIKASAGQVYGWYIYNDGAAEVYVKLYNKATAPVLASDTPVMTIPIPAASAANVFSDIGIPFATGIGWAATTGVADNDTGAPAANQVIANLLYN